MGSRHAVERIWRVRWQLPRVGRLWPLRLANQGMVQPCVAAGASVLVEEEAPASQVLGTLQGDPRELHSGNHHMKQGLHGELQCAPTG